jgi:SAM-dependent methyltransferase
MQFLYGFLIVLFIILIYLFGLKILIIPLAICFINEWVDSVNSNRIYGGSERNIIMTLHHLPSPNSISCDKYDAASTKKYMLYKILDKFQVKPSDLDTLKANSTDSQVYEFIKTRCKTDTFDTTQYKAKQLLHSLHNHRQPNSIKYLDFGCNNAKVTNAFANLLHLPSSNIYGIDILEPDKVELAKNNYSKASDKLPFADNFFALITANMTLHHLKEEDKDNTFSEFARVLKPGGILLLKEHDVDFTKNPEHAELLDVLHDLYRICGQESIVEFSSNKNTNEKATYRDFNWFKTNFAKHGLILSPEAKHYTPNYCKDPQMRYTSLFIKQ